MTHFAESGGIRAVRRITPPMSARPPLPGECVPAPGADPGQPNVEEISTAFRDGAAIGAHEARGP